MRCCLEHTPVFGFREDSASLACQAGAELVKNPIPHRRTGYDVTDTVNVCDAAEVCAAVTHILGAGLRAKDKSVIQRAFQDCDDLYNGRYPGFNECETPYHNLQHILDVTLAAARLMDGYRKRGDAPKLTQEVLALGVVVALYHDSGYIRRVHDSRHKHGAEYTKTHVSRGARFLREYLPQIGLGERSDDAAELIHFTGYERDLDTLAQGRDDLVAMGRIIGTADIIAQISDRVYLEKCRDFLFPEFELGGLLKSRDKNGSLVVIDSPEALLRRTPDFVRTIVNNRLGQSFQKTYEYAADHFGGPNYYVAEIEKNTEFMSHLIANDRLDRLSRSTEPEAETE